MIKTILLAMVMITKIVSGGQTGVDRAALDMSLELGLACGGWCPQGRKAEDGPIASSYPLTETPSADYRQRTRWNVRDSDGTLVLTRGKRRGGTALTITLAKRMRKPYLVLNLNKHLPLEKVREWAQTRQLQVLNVAGPRESENPGIYDQAGQFLRRLFSEGMGRAGKA
jgi:hypothetical protein